MRWIGVIHWINAIMGANRTPCWWCLWRELCWCWRNFLYHSYRRKPTKQEFFIPAQNYFVTTRTQIVVKLLMRYYDIAALMFVLSACQNKHYHILSVCCVPMKTKVAYMHYLLFILKREFGQIDDCEHETGPTRMTSNPNKAHKSKNEDPAPSYHPHLWQQ